MEDSRRLILAVTLSIIAIMLWNYFYVKPRQEEAVKLYEQEQELRKQREGIEPQDAVATSSDGESTEIDLEKLPGRDDIISQGGRVKISTDKLHGSISLKGARIDDLTLAGYHQLLDPASPEVVLLSPKGTRDVYFAEFGWLGSDKNIKLPDSNTIWQASKQVLSANDTLKLIWDNNEGLKFTINITLDENYLFDITQSVENTGIEEVKLFPYGRVNRAKDQKFKIYISHEGPLGVINDKLHEYDYKDMVDEGGESFENIRGWVGISDKYWLTAIIPPQDSSFNAKFGYLFKGGLNRYQADYIGQPETIAPGGKITVTQHLFAGAKNVELLDKYGAEHNIPLFDRAVDFGFLYFLTRPLFAVLKFFHQWVGNFGIAILLLTVCIKIVLFPLANKGYKSMARLRKHMPELQKLRERYEDDRQKLGVETMKFYKENNVNPASGCLPILIQIPIFFALYKVLYINIEMRHAPFYGWIKDLSAPDPTNIFNLFGLIPWEPWGWVPAIGVLPCLFCATMVVQQKINPPPTDPTQKMVMAWLPFIFLFLFAQFAAGLVLYWVWNGLLSIIQQYIITRRIEADRNE